MTFSERLTSFLPVKSNWAAAERKCGIKWYRIRDFANGDRSPEVAELVIMCKLLFDDEINICEFLQPTDDLAYSNQAFAPSIIDPVSMKKYTVALYISDVVIGKR